MQLLDALQSDRILLHLPAPTRAHVVHALAQVFTRGENRLRAADVEFALHSREQLSSTNLGQGVAIPHCRVAHLGAPRLALAVVDEGVDFQDGLEPVHIVVGLLGDQADPAAHLNTLVKLARLLRKPRLRARLASACSVDDVRAALLYAEDIPSWPVVQVTA